MGTRILRYLFAGALLAGQVFSAAAQEDAGDEIFHRREDRRRRSAIRMEWNVFLGISAAGYSAAGADISFDPKVGFQAGFDIGLVFHKNFALVPELRYTRASFDMTGRAGGETSVAGNTIDFPLLAEGRMLRGRLRIYAGPVFTLMDKCRFSYGGASENGMRIRPTVAYAAGIRCVPLRRMTLGVRYDGQFNRTGQIFGWRASDADYAVYDLGAHAFSVTIGYLF